MTEAFLKALTPAAIEATEQAMRQLEGDHDAALGQWRLTVERARYEAERAAYLYPCLRGGFGTFCLILLTSGIGLAIYCQSQPLLPGNRPQIPAIALISAGLIVYLIQTRFITGTTLLLFACLAGIGFLWFNPIFFNPLILSIAGLVLIFAGCIFRYLVLLNRYY